MPKASWNSVFPRPHGLKPACCIWEGSNFWQTEGLAFCLSSSAPRAHAAEAVAFWKALFFEQAQLNRHAHSHTWECCPFGQLRPNNHLEWLVAHRRSQRCLPWYWVQWWCLLHTAWRSWLGWSSCWSVNQGNRVLRPAPDFWIHCCRWWSRAENHYTARLSESCCRARRQNTARRLP